MVDYVVRYSISVAIVAMVNAAHPVNNASHASNACQAALNVTDEAGDAEYKVCLLHEVYPQGVRMRRDSPKGFGVFVSNYWRFFRLQYLC